MTDTKQPQATNQTERSSAPTHIAYHVRDVREGKGFWTRIGSAWPHKDGNGFNIQIDMVPLDGRITLRRPEEQSISKPPPRGRKAPTPQP